MYTIFTYANCRADGYMVDNIQRIKVTHLQTLNSITVLSVPEAYRISKLLDLENAVVNWYHNTGEIK